MNDFLLLFRLQGLEQQFTRIGFQAHRAACLDNEILRFDLPAVNQRQHQPIRPPRAEFFQNILRQTVAPRPIGVQKAHLRIQPHALQRAADVLAQNAVHKRQERIHPVSGRTAVAPFKSKAAFFAQKPPEHAEITRRRIAFNAAHHVQLRRALQLPQRNIQRIDRTLNRHILAIIANLPLKHPLTRLNLRRDDITRNRHRILLRHPILRPTQQHIAALPPLKPPQETSVFGKKRQIHIIFAAKPQQKRRHQHIPKTENMPDGMHRQLRHLLTLLLHHQRLPLLMQIAALGGDIQRVLQFAHEKTPWILTAVFGGV